MKIKYMDYYVMINHGDSYEIVKVNAPRVKYTQKEDGSLNFDYEYRDEVLASLYDTNIEDWRQIYDFYTEHGYIFSNFSKAKRKVKTWLKQDIERLQNNFSHINTLTRHDL